MKILRKLCSVMTVHMGLQILSTSQPWIKVIPIVLGFKDRSFIYTLFAITYISFLYMVD